MTVKKVITQSEFQKSLELAKKNSANSVTSPKTSKYIFLGGIPHKLVNGSYVQLTKIEK
jgi:hypothetical protein